MKKIFKAVVIATVIASLNVGTVSAGEWKQNDIGWWYDNGDGSWPANTSQIIDGTNYYFDERGYWIDDTQNKNVLSVDEQKRIWNDYISTGKYKACINESGERMYALKDVNADGQLEMFVSVGDYGWNYIWLFALDNGKPACVNKNYGYGTYRYSKKQNAVMGLPEFKGFGGNSSEPFYRLRGTQFDYIYQIVQDEGVWYYTDNSSERKISDAERKRYFDDAEYFDWKPIR